MLYIVVEGQIILMTVKGEQWLVVKTPYLEGMLPYEYSVILKALKELGIPKINVYLEATSIHDKSLNG